MYWQFKDVPIPSAKTDDFHKESADRAKKMVKPIYRMHKALRGELDARAAKKIGSAL